MLDRVCDAFTHARAADVSPFAPDAGEVVRRVDEVTRAIPEELRRDDLSPRRGLNQRASDAVVRRLLAAHAFANWTAHLGRGLRTWLRSVEAPFVLLMSDLDVRQVDLQLRHLAEPKELAKVWNTADVGH